MIRTQISRNTHLRLSGAVGNVPVAGGTMTVLDDEALLPGVDLLEAAAGVAAAAGVLAAAGVGAAAGVLHRPQVRLQKPPSVMNDCVQAPKAFCCAHVYAGVCLSVQTPASTIRRP